MPTYKANVTIEFDDDDLAELAQALGVEPEKMNPLDSLNGSLDNLDLGAGWVNEINIVDE